MQLYAQLRIAEYFLYDPLGDWPATQLAQVQRDFLASFEPTVEVEVDGLGRVLFCHATPRNDVDIFTERTREARVAPLFADVDAEIVVCGHTHVQFEREGPGRIRLLTGAPLDDWLDGRPGRVHHLAFATADPQEIGGARPATEDGTFEVDPTNNHGVRLRLSRTPASFASRPLG